MDRTITSSFARLGPATSAKGNPKALASSTALAFGSAALSEFGTDCPQNGQGRFDRLILLRSGIVSTSVPHIHRPNNYSYLSSLSGKTLSYLLLSLIETGNSHAIRERETGRAERAKA